MNLSPSHFGLPADRFPSFRPGQYDLASLLADSPTRFHLLQSPVGSGKSFMYVLAAILRESRTLILAPNKGLQRQIYDSFPSHVYNIYGHSHYPCSVRTSNGNPDPRSFDFECEDWGSCIYRQLVDDCQSRDTVLSNPAHHINNELIGDPSRLGKFDLLIVDEAHDLHTQIVNSIAFNPVSMIHGLFTLNIPSDDTNIQSWASWCSECIGKAKSLSSSTRGRKDKRSKTVVAKCDRLISRFSLFLASNDGNARWISIPDNRYGISLSPVWAAPFAERLVFRDIPHIILTSGTLQETPTVSRLGISAGEYTYTDNPSQFDPKRSPFIHVPSVQMKYDMTAGESRLQLSIIDTLLDECMPAGKVLIQSQSYDRTDEICTKSRHRTYLHTHSRGNSQDFADQLELFMAASAPYGFVSPRAKEGLDLHGDLCRAQILVKVPFLSLADPLTKERSEEDPGYAFAELAMSIEQIAGRDVRNMSDWGCKFLPDDQWKWVKDVCICGHGKRDHIADRVPGVTTSAKISHALKVTGLECKNKKCGCTVFRSIFSPSFLRTVISANSPQEAVRLYRILRKRVSVTETIGATQ